MRRRTLQERAMLEYACTPQDIRRALRSPRVIALLEHLRVPFVLATVSFAGETVDFNVGAVPAPLDIFYLRGPWLPWRRAVPLNLIVEPA